MIQVRLEGRSIRRVPPEKEKYREVRTFATVSKPLPKFVRDTGLART